MKHLVLFLLTIISFSIQAQEARIVFKVKENDKPEKSQTSTETGFSKIDMVSGRFNITKLKKLNTGRKSLSSTFVAAFPEGSDQTEIINAYMATGAVDYAEPDGIGAAGGVMASPPNDALYFRQWGLHNDGSFPLSNAVEGSDIDMENAWEVEDGSNSIIVATMDTGLNLNHPEFEGRLWVNTGEIPNNNIDDDNNGYVDDIRGWDYVNNDNVPADDNGHGTNVTGIIAANGQNTLGYSGVDRHCRLMTLKGLDSNSSGNYSWWIEAIAYAADNGANVINLSVGGNTFSTGLRDVIDYALANNVVVVACMMNTNSSVNYYPARYNNVIAVGSTDPDDTRSSPFFWDNFSGSNYGTHISVVAPGNFIYGLAHNSGSNYEVYWGGTSQATPLVSGLAALLLAQDPTRTPAEIKSIIESTAEDQVGAANEDTSGFDFFYGHGRINAFNALSQGLATPSVIADNRTISVYPNPSLGAVTVDAVVFPAKVTVHNTLGQWVINQIVTAENNTITIPGKGIYLLAINNGETVTSKKIIIK